MSRGGCYGMTNADWLISPPAAQILPGLLRERVRMAKIKETERVRIQSLPAFFFVSRVIRDASACEKHFPPVIGPVSKYLGTRSSAGLSGAASGQTSAQQISASRSKAMVPGLVTLELDN